MPVTSNGHAVGRADCRSLMAGGIDPAGDGGNRPFIIH